MKKVLIVEDEFVAANHLRLLLAAHNYHVLGIVRSVSQAREVIAQTTPDIVLLDIFIRGNENGIDLAKELKALSIPFIYISANSNAHVMTAAKDTQPEGFIVKPFRKEDILATLQNVD
jgi:response regulator of citrate/malate metabolism